jgi:transposase
MSLGKEIVSKCFEIANYEVIDVNHEATCFVLSLVRHSESLCPHCKQIQPRYDSTVQRFLIGTLNCRGVYGDTKIYRVHCREHGIVTEDHGIGVGKRRYSKAVSNVVVHYTQKLDNVCASQLFGVSESTIYRIDIDELSQMEQRYLEQLPEVKGLSVDEVAYKRRHNYASIISDYEHGKVLWLVKERTQHALKQGYQTLAPVLPQVKTVTLDLWPAFEKATRTCLPKATIIYDRFHISRLLNRAVEQERRAYQKQLPDEQRKQMKRHSRWVLLKRRENLSENDQQHLEELKQANEHLFELYLLKESCLSIFNLQSSSAQARKQLFAWIRSVLYELNFPALKRFANTLIKRIRNVLKWFTYPISNAKAEGINNVIKTLLKRAYGYKNFDYFRMKVLQKIGYLMNFATHRF